MRKGLLVAVLLPCVAFISGFCVLLMTLGLVEAPELEEALEECANILEGI